HLNGAKIAGPTVLARIPGEELAMLFRGYGYEPHFVEGDEPGIMHQKMAAALDRAVDSIQVMQRDARLHGFRRRLPWPMIVLRTPKGWTGPKVVDGKRVEGTYRSHQVPMDKASTDAAHRRLLERWMRSYRPRELFDEKGALRADLAQLAPRGERRMGANPHANGGGVV